MMDAKPDLMRDDLWRDVPKTVLAFDARFETEDDGRVCWIRVRWGGQPACAMCKSTPVWSLVDPSEHHVSALSPT